MSNYTLAMVTFTSSFITSLIALPPIMRLMREKGIVGIDFHKLNRPKIPEMGGLGALVGITVSTILTTLISPELAPKLVSFLLTMLIAGVIGAIDDLKPLSAKIKPILTATAGIPILLMRTYSPYMILPIVGRTRLTIVYPFLIIPAIAVTSNAVNMMDPFNGTMTGTCSIITVVLLLSAILLGHEDAVIMCAGLLGGLLALWYFNRYPSKVFVGDVGTLSVGAALGAIAIIGRMEVIAVVAFMPQIMNAFYGLSTIGRLYERREVARPVHLSEDGRLIASLDPKAPITLARMVLARGPLTEPEAVRVFLALSAISGALALFTTYLMLAIS